MSAGIDARELVGTHDILFITFDTLRYDVAQQMARENKTPFLASLLPGGGWEMRHSPGSFTYAAHSAIFAGFLPTPVTPGQHARLFAARFPGSETTADQTCIFDAPDIVQGLANHGYHTVCIGGVGFFNKQSPLGSVLPNLFHESHWRPEFGVTNPASTEEQVHMACSIIDHLPPRQRLFLFLNIAAIHQPNYFYLTQSEQSVQNKQDTLASHAAALVYVDGQLPRLFRALRRRAPILAILCSDHGTAYGEDGYSGHRLAHPVVWNVPYLECVLCQQEEMS